MMVFVVSDAMMITLIKMVLNDNDDVDDDDDDDNLGARQTIEIIYNFGVSGN